MTIDESIEGGYEEVYFDQYCPKCIHWENREWEYPCDECLIVPANICSHKPLKYEGKD